MEEEVLYQLALTRLEGIGNVYAKGLAGQFGSAKALFQAGQQLLAAAKVPPGLIDPILKFKDWAMLEKELLLIERKGIQPLLFTDAAYPQRLAKYTDAPPILFYKGKADLNAKKIVAVVGTRSPSDYGKAITDQLIRQLARPDMLLISGLAHGIDACAHSAALKYNMPTVGVLGHGLDQIYPPQNAGLARAMLSEGGLLTSFGLHTRANNFHFPMRNHIVAGLCDVLLVVETGRKGGSLITVEKAKEYDKKIFAVPGRLTDIRSSGCNMLIQEGKAELLFSGQQLLSAMGWEWPADQEGTQALLPFQTAQPDAAGTAAGTAAFHAAGDNQPSPAGASQTAERQLLQLLTETKSPSIDELIASSRLEASVVRLHLLNLELQGLISALPGKRYRLNYSYAAPAA